MNILYIAKKCYEKSDFLDNNFLKTLFSFDSVKKLFTSFKLKDEHYDFCNKIFLLYIECDELNICNKLIADIYSFNILKNNLDIHIIDFYEYLNNLCKLLNKFDNIKINIQDNFILNSINILA